MKIIFKDETEKNLFVRRWCPADILEDYHEICYAYEGSPDKCEKCWEKNIEMEVEDENIKC